MSLYERDVTRTVAAIHAAAADNRVSVQKDVPGSEVVMDYIGCRRMMTYGIIVIAVASNHISGFRFTIPEKLNLDPV